MAKKKKKWIAKAIKHSGALTRKAKAAGMTVAKYVANPPKRITATTEKKIVLVKTLKKIRRKKSK